MQYMQSVKILSYPLQAIQVIFMGAIVQSPLWRFLVVKWSLQSLTPIVRDFVKNKESKNIAANGYAKTRASILSKLRQISPGWGYLDGFRLESW